MLNTELFREAERVKQLAVSAYSPGKMLAATFKNGMVTKTVYYYNPRDIPPTVPIEYWNTLYLYTIQTNEKMQDLIAHEQAKIRHRQALEQAKHGLLGTKQELD